MKTPKLSIGLLPVLIALVLVGHVGVALGGTPGQAKYDFRVSDEPAVGLRQPALARNKTMYIGGDDGRVYAIRPNGTMRWVYEAGAPVTTNAAVYYSPDGQNAEYDGTIYVGLEDGRVLALEPTGTLKWTFEAGSPINASPALAADGTIYVGCEPTMLVAIRPDGSQRWRRVLPGGEGIHDPVVGPDGTIYFSNRQTQDLYAYDSAGALKWSTHLLGGIRSAAAIGKDGTIYVTGGHSLHAIWPDGDPKWKFDLGFDVFLQAAPVIGHQGTIYVSADGLVAINPDGSWEWDFWHDGEWPRVICSAAVDSSGLIYAPGLDGHIYCIAPGGTFVWRHYAGGNWLSALVVGNDGLLYSADYNRVRALYTGATGPFDGPWPMYRRDPECSARLDTLWSIKDALRELAVFVTRADLKQRIKDHLVVRLESVKRSLDAGLLLPAIHKLGAFIHYVQAQEGNQIPPEIADILIRDALHILMLADTYDGHHKPCKWRCRCRCGWNWGRKPHCFRPRCCSTTGQVAAPRPRTCRRKGGS